MRDGVLLVGNPHVVHVGAHLAAGAAEMGVGARLLDSEQAYAGSTLTRKINWSLRGHRPSRLRAFSADVCAACEAPGTRVLVATGIAPIDDAALDAAGRLGIVRMNYLTDDPWNPAHRAAWFMRALPRYDCVFSTRRSNLDDLNRHGCRRVAYLPFGYAPGLHFVEPPLAGDEATRFASDVVFAGGADPDRVPLIERLVDAGMDVALYGGYWQRYASTRAHARGHADPATLRKAVTGGRVALCLVRRANRDGSAMRSFEVAAMGGCMLVEDTAEHHEIFGADGESVIYFDSPDAIVERARWLLDHADERARLTRAVRARILAGRHTYADRLATMLDAAARVTSR